MNIDEYDETGDIARLLADGFAPHQIEAIVSVRRRLFHLGKGPRKARANERTREKEVQACPFMSLLGALRATLR